MKYFKGKYSERSGGRVRETSFHSRRKIFMLWEKKSGGWSVSYWLHSPWKFLKFLLLIQTLNVTMSNPPAVPRAAFDSGSGWDTCMLSPGRQSAKAIWGWGGWGEGSFLRIAGFLYLQATTVPWGLQLEARVIQMCSKQLETMLFILRGCPTSAHWDKGKESISSWTLSHSGAAYQR